jgi:hypothetical protein
MTQALLVFENFDLTEALLVEEINNKTVDATDDLLKFVVAALNAGEFGLKSERHALAESLYVEATGRDDYQAARDAARKAFETNGEEPTEKQVESFEAMMATHSDLPEKGDHIFVAALSTMLAYGTWWETDGGRAWMQPAAFEWAATRAKAIFEELRGSL